ncbi:MAG: MBL fold metallo-hydrolase [Deltaproteobacteria bacterium]|jgi:glyoxylase-like metal-dependent hydrolase (beta-lactamase superfamily II)|nr:MBL fold metallo-hydrolase [Deltaproteobacteria bacterium]
MPIKTFVLGPLETNCYVLHDKAYALAVDPGGDPAEALAFLKAEQLTLLAILNTHLHFDHILGNAALHAATGAPIRTPAGDAYLMESELGSGGMWGFPKVPAFAGTPLPEGEHSFGPFCCRVLHTPGHSPGSLCFAVPSEQAVFVGDLIFYRGVGRTDFPGGDAGALLRSIQMKIFTLPGDTRLYPGHGLRTSVADEQRNNPYCGAFGSER